ncbi:MAG: DNA replication/repair protein RecF [Gammaproteobacteria bacterium]|nr:DNA replication/repair protein RecF [Gammaproteobacteria bacterium]
MKLHSLSLHHFRCFSQYQTTLHPRFNYIIGENGSGKTAFLEAISLLSRAQSFRIRETAPLIQTQQDQLTVMTHLADTQTIGIQKSRDAHTSIKINGQSCFRTSELANLLPSQVIYQDVFQIIDAGPMIRRQLLDWGVFHVKPFYHDWWKQYRQALKQRNALLKAQAKKTEFAIWNRTLCDLSKNMDEARQDYVDTLEPIFKAILKTLTQLDCDLAYFNGWDRQRQGQPLATVLEATHEADRKKQYTQFGPHHADLELLNPAGKVKQFLSRGQQKMLLLTLKLAQAQLLDKPCLYLWDDICAELDEGHLEKLGRLIQDIPGQYFITGIQVDRSVLAELNPGLVISHGAG